MSASSRLWQGGAATRRLERLRQTSGPECKRTCRPWCGRPSILWGKPSAMSTTAVARAGSREPARAYRGWAEPAWRDNAVCVNAGDLGAAVSPRGVRRAHSSGDAPRKRGGAKGPWSTGAGVSSLPMWAPIGESLSSVRREGSAPPAGGDETGSSCSWSLSLSGKELRSREPYTGNPSVRFGEVGGGASPHPYSISDGAEVNDSWCNSTESDCAGRARGPASE